MITHDLIQGSPEWQLFRVNYHGASEAAAMLGLSSHTTRAELLRMKYLNDAKQFSDWVQRHVLDYGHQVEAMARPLVEQVIGTELYPVTCSLGRLSASLDGLTMAEDVAFEHKQWNVELAAAVAQGQLPDEFMPQCQQIMLVTGAEKVMFVVSDGTVDNMVMMEVFPDKAWQDRIVGGWNTFMGDLVDYELPAVEVKPAADPIMSLPALSIQINGQVVASNLDDFKARADAFIASIKTELLTDEDFAQAEATVKFCADAEQALAIGKKSALAQMEDVDYLMRTVDHISEQMRAKRLALEKLVDAKKKSIREGIIEKAMREFAAHVAGLEDEIKPIRLIVQARDFAGAMRGRRTIATLRNAADTELAAGKITVDALAKGIRSRLAWYREHAAGHELLFADLQNLIQKADDDFKLAVMARLKAHQDAEAAKAALVAMPGSGSGGGTGTSSGTMMSVSVGYGGGGVGGGGGPRSGAPTLRLGDICERLRFTVNAEFLASLGFSATQVKGAKLFHEADFPLICAAICRHISAVQAQHKAAA
jgi:predicted phage-related endonuclease